MAATPGYLVNRTPASFVGGAVGPQGVIDCAAASRNLRRKVVTIPLPTLVTNATTNHGLGALGINGNIVSASITYRVLPLVAGGTATFRLAFWNGTTQTFLTAATDLLSGLTARVGNLLTLAPAAEPNILAANGIEFAVTVSNHAVTQGTDGFLTLVIDPNDPTPISQ